MEIQYNEKKKRSFILQYFPSVIFVLSLFVLAIILIQLRAGVSIFGDQALGKFAASITNPVTKIIFAGISELGSTYGIGSLFLLFMLLLWWKYRDYIGMLIITIIVLGGDQLNDFLKEAIGRERPVHEGKIIEEGFSFPSGHAMVGLPFYGFITYYFANKIKSTKARAIFIGFMVVAILLIGFSRIILRVHFPSDVIGGFAIGIVLLYCCISIYSLFAKRRA